MTTLPQPLRGIIPPLLTPLKDGNTLDVPGLENLVERLLSGGVHGLFMLGTCGEGPSLSDALRREMIERVLQIAGDKVPLLVAITDTSINESISLAEYAAEKGCTGLVLSTPYYYPITQDNLKRYLATIAEKLPLPVILYNIPSHTKVWFEIDTLREAFENPRFVGLKDSSADMSYFCKAAQLMKSRSDLTLLVGPEELIIPAMQNGGHGGICGGAHLLPRLFVDIFEASQQATEERLDKLEQRLFALGTLYDSFEGASFLSTMKCALSILGICNDAFAEPLHPLPESRRSLIADKLTQLGITRETLT